MDERSAIEARIEALEHQVQLAKLKNEILSNSQSFTAEEPVPSFTFQDPHAFKSPENSGVSLSADIPRPTLL